MTPSATKEDSGGSVDSSTRETNARNTATVSVIIPAFNAEMTLERAVRSVVSQTGVQVTVIIIDDASTDHTPAVIERLRDSQVQALRLNANRGAAAARNCGVALATSEYIAFLDADDEWLPGKLALQIQAFLDEPRATLVYCEALSVSYSGEVRSHHRLHRPHQGSDGWKALLVENFIPTPTVLVRRADIIAVGGFRSDLRFAEDLDLWLRLARSGDLVYVEKPLVKFYARREGLSLSQPLAEIDYLQPVIDFHVSVNRQWLSRAERRAIIGRRSFEIGYRAMRAHASGRACWLMLRAALNGHRVVKASLLLALCSVRRSAALIGLRV